MTLARKLLLSGPLLYASAAGATTDADLQHVLEQRLIGDRTGACVAAAVIDHDKVARSIVCADPKQRGRLSANSAFEIGSVSKTMTAALLARLIVQHHASLDDPLSAWLPAGTKVPDFHGEPIRLRHIVTHTSGLPGLPTRMHPANPANPYADLDEAMLLASLGDVTLQQAPGSHFAYSNYAMMLLSLALAHRSGEDMEHLLQEQLFKPLGMQHAYLDKVPQGITPALGHLPNQNVTSPWTMPIDMAGFGGVRATLDDMIGYVQAEMGQGGIDATTQTGLQLTQQPIRTHSGHAMGMNWMLFPAGQHTLVVHEGGTGGFSSFVGFDPTTRRGVVLLSDTTLNSMGGLGQGLGMYLLDPTSPLGSPHRASPAPGALLDALVGNYTLQGGMTLTLRRKGNALTVQAVGQPEFLLGYDSAGDFYPTAFDALLHPRRHPDGQYDFVWVQGGGVIPAQRTPTPQPSSTH